MSDASRPLDEALRRRADLLSAVERVEQVLSSPSARDGWRDDARRDFTTLRDAVRAHVDVTEGEDGLFADVLDEAPRLAHQIDVLRAEHDAIVADIDALLRLDGSPDEVRDAATAVLGRILRHRQKGADLLYEAYDVDVSAMD